MDNLKKIGLTALAGSLAAVSANAAEMSVSGATLLTYTSEDPTESTGNPYGMKTNLAFTASGDVNGYTVSYYQASKDQFAGMSSASLSVDMGDLGVIGFDQGVGRSRLSTIDDKTPTAAEEIWDGLDTTTSGRVGAGNAGAIGYDKTFGATAFTASYLNQGGGTNGDGGTTPGTAGSSWDFAVQQDLGDGFEGGAGYGVIGAGSGDGKQTDDSEHMTAFVNYTYGMVTAGYQLAEENNGAKGGSDEQTNAWGIAVNVNDDLSVSYGEREVEFAKASADHVTEKTTGIAVAYTMGSIKIAGNMNDGKGLGGVTGADDEMTEIALSFAF